MKNLFAGGCNYVALSMGIKTHGIIVFVSSFFMYYIGANSVSQNIYYPPWNSYDATPDGYPRTLQRFFPGKDMAATKPQPTSKLCQWCSEATCECSNRFKLVATALTNPSKVRPQNLHESFASYHICAVICITRPRRPLLPSINSWPRKHLKMILKRRRCARVIKPCWACARLPSIRITILTQLVHSIRAACLAKENGPTPFQIYEKALLEKKVCGTSAYELAPR